MDNRLSGLLGLSRRAGRLTSGSDAVLRDISGRRAALVLIASDASPRTAAAMRDACLANNVRAVSLPVGKEELGLTIGRGETAVLCVTDHSFASGIYEICRTLTGGIC